MSYQIGQFKRTDLNSTEYENTIAKLAEPETGLVQGTVTSIYNDSCIDGVIRFEENSKKKFAAGTTYKINLRLKLQEVAKFNGSIQIKLSDGVDKYQIIKNIPINIENSTYSYSRTVFFMPRYDFSSVVFEIVRTGENAEYGGVFVAEEAEVIEMTNILSKIKVPKIRKLGLQASEGTRFTINGAEIKLGKSGVFMSKEMDITSVCFEINSSNNIEYNEYEDKIVQPDKKTFFIMDYQY